MLANQAPNTLSHPTKMVLQTWQPACDPSLSCGAVSAQQEGVWQRVPASQSPQDPLRPAPSLRRWVGPSGWRHAAVCGGLKAGRGAQPQPHEKSCVLHLPAALSWLLTPLLSLHVPQEPAFEVALSKWALTFMEFLRQVEWPTCGCSLFSQPGWCRDGYQDSTDCWSLDFLPDTDVPCPRNCLI